MPSAQINNVFQIKIVIDADATGTVSTTVPRPLTVLGVDVICTATNAAGTLTVANGGSSLTNAIACATDGAVTAASSIGDEFAVFAAGDLLNVTANGAADRGIVVVYCTDVGQSLTVA